MKVQLIDFNFFTDERGSLIPVESNKDIPFEIKRIYYLFNLKEDKHRGQHAHHETQEVLLCIRGTCNITLDNGHAQTVTRLNQPNQGIVIPSMTWHFMHDFSDDALLLVFANTHHDKNDYILDYEQFKTLALHSHPTSRTH